MLTCAKANGNITIWWSSGFTLTVPAHTRLGNNILLIYHWLEGNKGLKPFLKSFQIYIKMLDILLKLLLALAHVSTHMSCGLFLHRSDLSSQRTRRRTMEVTDRKYFCCIYFLNNFLQVTFISDHVLFWRESECERF